VNKLSYNNILLIIFSLLIIVFLGFEFNSIGDLYIYLSASSDLFSSDIYKELYGRPPLFFYMGNPFFTLCLYPITYLPFQLTSILWKLLNIILLLRVWKIIESYFYKNELPSKKGKIWLLSTFGASIFVIYANLHIVQLTILMLYFSLEGIYQIIKKENTLIGSLAISAAIAIKISPIVLLPYLVYRRYHKASLLIVLICFSFFFAPAFFLGWEKSYSLWSEWWAIIDPQATIFDMNNRKNHGISALLSTLFIENIQDNVKNLTHRRHLINLGEHAVFFLINSGRLLLVLITLYFLRTKPFKRIADNVFLFWELSYLLLVIPLIFPQQRTYNFLFLMPALAYLCFYFIHHKENIDYYKFKLYTFIFSVLLLNLELLLGQFRKYYWHHKTITYAAILILILLMVIKPLELSKKKLNISPTLS